MNPRMQLLDPEIQRILRQSAAREAARKAAPQRRHHITQAAIFILSAIAIALVDLGHTQQMRFWGNAVGLAAQPFWLLSTWRHRQWGMLALSVFYVGVWTTGVARYW